METKQVVQFIRTKSEAKVPTKAFPTDIGFDLTAISVEKQISDNTFLFNTGIIVIPPKGFYVEIVPRSSLSKTGWMLSNSVGTIDPSFRGPLLIALTKVDDSNKCWLPDELPFTRCQLILRHAVDFTLQPTLGFENTDRGDGGFGSTDNPRLIEPTNELSQQG